MFECNWSKGWAYPSEAELLLFMDDVCDESEAARPAASSIAVSVSVRLTYKSVKADTDYGW